MDFKMTYSARTLALGLGFFALAIFPSAFRMIFGASSIRNGVMMGMLVFFVLAIPFGVRYFITSKIILVNLALLFTISCFYLISTLFYSGTDYVRVLASASLLLTMSFMSVVFVTTLDSLKADVFHKIILVGSHFLIFLGCLAVLLHSMSMLPGKSLILFTEPSHYAICLVPFLFYATYTSSKNRYVMLYILFGVSLALLLKSLTLLVGCSMIIFLCFGRRFLILILIFAALAVMSIVVDLEYFTQRLNFSSENENLSTLVFLSGWERAYLSFTDSYGFGVGFNQFGIVGPQGKLQLVIENILHGPRLNVKDGGTLASKLIAETGWLGLTLLIFYVFSSIKILKNLIFRRLQGSKDIFFCGVFLFFSIEVFVRGMGYFSILSFLFLSSMYWIHRNKILKSR
jgi:hypothetical protein